MNLQSTLLAHRRLWFLHSTFFLSFPFLSFLPFSFFKFKSFTSELPQARARVSYLLKLNALLPILFFFAFISLQVLLRLPLNHLRFRLLAEVSPHNKLRWLARAFLYTPILEPLARSFRHLISNNIGFLYLSWFSHSFTGIVIRRTGRCLGSVVYLQAECARDVSYYEY